MSCPTCNPDCSCACTTQKPFDAGTSLRDGVDDLNQTIDTELSRILRAMLESKPSFDAFVDGLAFLSNVHIFKALFPKQGQHIFNILQARQALKNVTLAANKIKESE